MKENHNITKKIAKNKRKSKTQESWVFKTDWLLKKPKKNQNKIVKYKFRSETLIPCQIG
jgi:hypothetical protein